MRSSVAFIGFAFKVAVVSLLSTASAMGAIEEGMEEEDNLLKTHDSHTFHGGLICEVASSYLASSGSLCDTRPVTSQELDFMWEFGDYGWIDGYAWGISSLHDSQKDTHREIFHEFESSIRYGYEWKIVQQVSLRSSLGPLWNPQIGYPDDHNNYWGPIINQSLENPYVTPYYNLLWLLEPAKRGRARIGIRRSFDIVEDVSLKIFAETVWSDHRRYTAKYGAAPERAFLNGAFSTERVGLQLRWMLSDSLSAYVQVQQFKVFGDQARSAVKKSSAYYAKTDWVLGSIGFEYAF